jgi:hypothetical protein
MKIGEKNEAKSTGKERPRRLCTHPGVVVVNKLVV